MHLRRLVAIYLWNFIQVRWETFTSRYGKFNQENVYETLSESASFCKSYDKNFFDLFFGSQFQLTLTCKTWMRFTTYGIEQSSSMGRVGSGRVGWVKKIESTSNSGVETLLRWDGKRLHFCMTNLLEARRSKFYQNRSGFVEDMTKTRWSVFRFTVYVCPQIFAALNCCGGRATGCRVP